MYKKNQKVYTFLKTDIKISVRNEKKVTFWNKKKISKFKKLFEKARKNFEKKIQIRS